MSVSESPEVRRSFVERATARLRVANSTDNEDVLALMREVPMQGNLAIATERGPDFFSLYRQQRGDARLYVYRDDENVLKGMGGIIIRDGYLDGKKQKVGYLADLRTAGLLRERLAFPQVYGNVIDRVVEETGCNTFITAVLADNEMAIRALASSSSKASKRRAQPYYHLLHRFDMAAIHFLFKKKHKPKATGLHVRFATDSDVLSIASVLHADHQRRSFGYSFDDGEFQHRLAHYPGFQIARTVVVENAENQIVGVCTCYDTEAVKRYRVMRYQSTMLWVKRALSLCAHITGTAPLPDVSADFRYFYLANLSIVDDNPQVFRAMIDFIYAQFCNDGYHFFAFPLYENDPLNNNLGNYFVRRLPFHLYAVTPQNVARTTWPVARCGFEMALA